MPSLLPLPVSDVHANEGGHAIINSDIHADINANADAVANTYQGGAAITHADSGQHVDPGADQHAIADVDASTAKPDADFFFITVAHFHGDHREPGEPFFAYTCAPSYLGPSRCPTCGKQFQLRIEPAD